MLRLAAAETQEAEEGGGDGERFFWRHDSGPRAVGTGEDDEKDGKEKVVPREEENAESGAEEEEFPRDEKGRAGEGGGEAEGESSRANPNRERVGTVEEENEREDEVERDDEL